MLFSLLFNFTFKSVRRLLSSKVKMIRKDLLLKVYLSSPAHATAASIPSYYLCFFLTEKVTLCTTRDGTHQFIQRVPYWWAFGFFPSFAFAFATVSNHVLLCSGSIPGVRRGRRVVKGHLPTPLAWMSSSLPFCAPTASSQSEPSRFGVLPI